MINFGCGLVGGLIALWLDGQPFGPHFWGGLIGLASATFANLLSHALKR